MTEGRNPLYWDTIRSSAHEILNVRSEVTKEQSRPADLVEWIGGTLARPMLFVALLSGHLLWVLLNLPIYPMFEPWDPYPFVFLATFASTEAPFIALLVLMYQRRSARISELREELDLQVSLHLERQISTMLRLLIEAQAALKVESQEDAEMLERLQQELDPKLLMQSIRRQLQHNEDSERATAP